LGLNFCPKCGTKLDASSDTCIKCGYNISERKNNYELAEEIQNSSIEYADFVQRAFAWFIDMIVVILISSPLSLFLNFGSILLLTNFYNFLIGFCYFWLLEAFNNGQTLGKFMLKIRAVNNENLKIANPTMYALNNLTKASGFLILDLIFGILFYYSEQDSNKNILRFTQHLAHIAVIKA